MLHLQNNKANLTSFCVIPKHHYRHLHSCRANCDSQSCVEQERIKLRLVRPTKLNKKNLRHSVERETGLAIPVNVIPLHCHNFEEKSIDNENPVNYEANINARARFVYSKYFVADQTKIVIILVCGADKPAKKDNRNLKKDSD